MVVDEDLLNAVLPFKALWEKKRVEIHGRFSSPAVCERALDELLFCEEIVLEVLNMQLAFTRPFTSFGGVQRARCLYMAHTSCHMEAVDVAAWLHRNTQWGKRSFLITHDSNTNVQAVLKILKEVRQILNHY